jgi:hypothetical protein
MFICNGTPSTESSIKGTVFALSTRPIEILRDVIDKVIVVAYQEDVSKLVSSLKLEGFNVEISRPDYSPEEMTYRRSSRCLLNHRNAWKRALDHPRYTLICEADFVPCRGIGDFEVFWPIEKVCAWGYLYQGSPRLLAMVGQRPFLRGHNATTVSYVINSTVASLMLKFFEIEKGTYDFGSYFAWDAHLQWCVMGLGAEAFIPMRHYGEHGGTPNLEHGKLGRIGRDGRHRADNLMNALHFLPQYANGSYLSYFRARVGARLSGFGRLLMGRWILETNVYNLSALDVIKMYLVGLRRLVSLPL